VINSLIMTLDKSYSIVYYAFLQSLNVSGGATKH